MQTNEDKITIDHTGIVEQNKNYSHVSCRMCSAYKSFLILISNNNKTL